MKHHYTFKYICLQINIAYIYDYIYEHIYENFKPNSVENDSTCRARKD